MAWYCFYLQTLLLVNVCGRVTKVNNNNNNKNEKMNKSIKGKVLVALPFRCYRVHIFTGWPGDPFAPGRPVSPCYVS